MSLTVDKSLQERLSLLSLQIQLQGRFYASDRKMAQSIGSQILTQDRPSL